MIPVLPFTVPPVLRTGRRHSSILLLLHFTSLAYRHQKRVTLLPLALQGASLGHFAAEAPDAAMLRLLMERGIKLDVRDKQGNRPIHWAAKEGLLDNLKLLVEEAGVEVWLQEKDMRSTLDHAACSGSVPIVRYLIEERGMDPTQVNKEVCLPLSTAHVFFKQHSG